MRFYLGTHQPDWLPRTDVPLFVSAVRLRGRRTVGPACGSWALDSGGFTELSRHGRWTIGPRQYADETRRWRDQAGGLEWAAQQDWMCEPGIIAGCPDKGWPGTHLSVREHQMRTVENYHQLRQLAPEVPWAPVIQGYHPDEYLAHAEAWEASGVRLAALSVVGVGSVCRRQGTAEAVEIFQALAAQDLRNLHGFGLKTLGLPRCAPYLASADSLAWSSRARHGRIRLPGCEHKTCGNCIKWALTWRERIVRLAARAVVRPRQLTLV